MSTSDEGVSGPARRSGPPAVWPPFVRAALWLAGSAGFSLGAALFAASTSGMTVGPWWPAAAEAHGHIQLFGWSGLMVLGVGLHFLPRLRGGPPVHPAWARRAFMLLVSGLVLRAISQPFLAEAGAVTIRSALLHTCLIASGALELAGACIVLGLLARAAREGPPLRSRAALWPVLPFFVVAFGAYWIALGVNLVGLIGTGEAGGALVAGRLDDLTYQLAFYGFLVPISAVMSERTFPLFFRTPRPRLRLLRAGLAVLLAGLVLRIAGTLTDAAPLLGLGELTGAAAIGLFVLALGIFAPRRPLPRQPVRPLRDPIQLHAIAAYLWLIVVAAFLVQNGLAALGVPINPVPRDAERHALGSGFVTLLILGLGAQLLPSFAYRRLRSVALVWVTLALGNLAALCRIGPLLAPAVFAGAAGVVLSLAGVAALAALLVFCLNVPTAPRR